MSNSYVSPHVTRVPKFEGMSTGEKENVVDGQNLCLSFLLPGHRLSQSRSRTRCTIENCGMRHHSLVHEVDLKFIYLFIYLFERARAKHQQKRVAETEGDQVPSPHPLIRRARIHVKIRLYASSITTQRTQVANVGVAR